MRERAKFVLIGCENSFENCFCVSMESNKTDEYNAYIKVDGEDVYLDIKDEEIANIIASIEKEEKEVTPDFVTENPVKVNIPENLGLEVMKSTMWNEYNERCIACGRCNFVCPTCTCFTMQDIFYKENERVGERRRVWASCQVDGYSDMAGGHSFRKKQGERSRCFINLCHGITQFMFKFAHGLILLSEISNINLWIITGYIEIFFCHFSQKISRPALRR